MKCESCNCSLEGLHAYGKTLDENLCCVCWFALLESEKVVTEVVSAIREECEELGIDLKGGEDAEAMIAMIEKKIEGLEEDIRFYEGEVRSLEARSEKLEILQEKIKKAAQKELVTT